jgi:hypothetical protein
VSGNQEAVIDARSRYQWQRLWGVAWVCLLAGCTVPRSYPVPPPPPWAEMVPAPPPSSTTLIWQPGHYDWTGDHYEWISGQWVERGGHGTLWQDGYWRRQGNGYVWIPGHWI